MRTEKELMTDCKLHFKGDTDAYLVYLRLKVDENLINDNLKTAKVFLQDVVTFRNILKRKSNDKN